MKFQYSQLDKKMENIEGVLKNIEERDMKTPHWVNI